MRTANIAQAWMALVGLVLVAAGLVGFLNTPLAGSSANALLQTDTVHNVVHVLTGRSGEPRTRIEAVADALAVG